MLRYKKLLPLAFFLILISVIFGTISIYNLYESVVNQHKLWLSNIVHNKVIILETLSQSTNKGNTQNTTKPSYPMINKVIKAFNKTKSIGQTGEILFAMKKDKGFYFITLDKKNGSPLQHFYNFGSNKAIPMQLAFQGKIGTVIADDYDNIEVLAAYAPVASLNFGVVAKMDMEEVRAPFYNFLITNMIINILVIAFGVMTLSYFYMRMLKRLEEKENRHKLLLDFLPIGIYQSDSLGNFRFMNKKCRDILKLSDTKLESLSLHHIIYPEDQALIRKEVLEKNSITDSYVSRFRLVDSNGSPVPVIGQTIAIKQENHVTQDYIWSFRPEKDEDLLEESLRQYQIRLEDKAQELSHLNSSLLNEIKAREIVENSIKEASRLLELFFKYTLDSVVLLDKNFNFIKVNEVYARSCSRDISFFPGKNHFEIYPSDFELTAKEVVETKKPFFTTARPFVFPDHPEWGTTYWDISLVPVLDEDTDVELLVFTLKDVTEHKKAELELEELLEKRTQDLIRLQENESIIRMQIDLLEKNNQELEEFNYVASHDLQEPLRTLSSFCTLLKTDIGENLPYKAEEDIRFISDATERMRLVVHDLLQLSRAGRGDLALSDVHLSDCMNDVTADLSAAISESQSIIEWDNLPIVTADKPKITRVLQNLVNNAIKFRNTERPHIVVSSKKIEDMWEISVKDNGIGIDEKYYEYIFTPFKRLHNMTKYHGSGIGLAICKKIVGTYHGKIWVDSIEDEGSTFFFTIPKEAKSQS